MFLLHSWYPSVFWQCNLNRLSSVSVVQQNTINWVFPKFQLISKIWQTLKIKNKMVTHHGIRLVLGCLTSVICPFTLTVLTFGSWLYCANVSPYKDEWAVNFNIFAPRDNRISNLNASITAQHKHEPIMKAVRVNGQITEVKQPWTNLILIPRWVTITFFFSGRNIRQFRQIAKFY